MRFLDPRPKTLLKTVRWAATEADPVVRRMILGNGREAVKARLRGTKLF
ncbi:hypothetical protein [Streptomyces galbus]|uniref:Uncharacterized protein n=1 Tax=Streptomyces galbus TaxID=33898 RepID=A0ABX1IHS5_STRGB|nr:hypothetical protein [Streptomyces galbus]NKQ24772.1 hypothetical protein [Streptomyces galbus]